MDVVSRITDLIEPSLNGMGFELVRVSFQSGTLQIMAERRESADFTIEDCAQISHTVSALLDVSDPIKGRYQLEISSPGLDRPLVRLSDYERFSGQPARLELKLARDGQKRFKGVVRGAHGQKVRLQLEEGEEIIELPFADIAQARLDVSGEMFGRNTKPVRGRGGKKQTGTKAGARPAKNGVKKEKAS